MVEHELVTGEVALAELKRVLLKRIKIPPRTVNDIERLLLENEVVAKPRRHLQLGLRDVDDEWIVVSAVTGNAGALVTGDRDILETTVPLPLRVCTPRRFWEQARGGKSG